MTRFRFAGNVVQPSAIYDATITLTVFFPFVTVSFLTSPNKYVFQLDYHGCKKKRYRPENHELWRKYVVKVPRTNLCQCNLAVVITRNRDDIGPTTIHLFFMQMHENNLFA